MASIWDNPELKMGGDYFKFETPGDTITGVVQSIKAHTWPDGSVAPQLLLSTAEGDRSVTASQFMLKQLLADTRPEIGDTITITFTEIEPRPMGKTLKKFTVIKGGGASVTATPATGGLDISNLSPEQLKALQELGATPA